MSSPANQPQIQETGNPPHVMQEIAEDVANTKQVLSSTLSEFGDEAEIEPDPYSLYE